MEYSDVIGVLIPLTVVVVVGDIFIIDVIVVNAVVAGVVEEWSSSTFSM